MAPDAHRPSLFSRMSSRRSRPRPSRMPSRRFSVVAMEGFREVEQGTYSVAGSAMKLLTINTDFDLEHYAGRHESVWSSPASSATASRRSSTRTLNEDQLASIDEKPPLQKTETLYHVSTKRQKWFTVWIIGFAGLFSGLSSNIYFPSLEAIAQDLNVTAAAVSLTITTYLIVQGISPLLWGSLSDALGRRPIYIYSFIVYIIANAVLSFSPSYVVLLVFRGIQAAGSASTVSIGNGVIQDISPSSERGGFISFYQAIRNFSIAIGPVLGGVLGNFLGFRSTFVFLLILSCLTLAMIILFLPETMRRIAGPGDVDLKGIHAPLIWRFGKKPPYLRELDPHVTRPKINLHTFTKPLLLLCDRSVLMALIPGGIVYAVWSMVTASTTNLFEDIFGLNVLLLGIAFIPNGLGTIAGSMVIGKLMDRDFNTVEIQYKMQNGLPWEFKLPKKNLPVDFPIERARLRNVWWVLALFLMSTAFYGWTLEDESFTAKKGAIVLPLLLQFIIAGTSNAIFAINQTLVTDLCPGKGASSTALNNLVRCSLAAVGVAFIDQMIKALGPGMSFVWLAVISCVCIPLLFIEYGWSQVWRLQKDRKRSDEEIEGA